MLAILTHSKYQNCKLLKGKRKGTFVIFKCPPQHARYLNSWLSIASWGGSMYFGRTKPRAPGSPHIGKPRKDNPSLLFSAGGENGT